MMQGDTSRHEVHQMIDQVPEDTLPKVVRFLETLLDPVRAAMDAAPPDDEPYTDEDRQAVTESLEDVAKGRVVSLETLMQQYGVAPEL